MALADCITWMKTRNMIKTNPLRDNVAAISCGIYQGTPVLDLDYAEDSEADTDANFVMTGKGGIVEIQGTAEGAPFSEEELLTLMGLAKNGIAELVELQKKAIAQAPQNNGLRLTLAKIYLENGDKVNARAELDTLAKLGDKFPGQAAISKLQNEL